MNVHHLAAFYNLLLTTLHSIVTTTGQLPLPTIRGSTLTLFGVLLAIIPNPAIHYHGFLQSGRALKLTASDHAEFNGWIAPSSAFLLVRPTNLGRHVPTATTSRGNVVLRKLIALPPLLLLS